MKLNNDLKAAIKNILSGYSGALLCAKEGEFLCKDIPFKNDCVMVSHLGVDMWINKELFIKEFWDDIKEISAEWIDLK